MSDMHHTPHAGVPSLRHITDIRADLRPSGHHLMLLLRAAVADDGRGGPYLTTMRTHTADGTQLFCGHVSVAPVEWHSHARLVMLTGDDALAYAVAAQWPLQSITDPSTTELRALAEHAVTQIDAVTWARTYGTWHEQYMSPTETRRRNAQAEASRSAARALRWRLAEQWLARP